MPFFRRQRKEINADEVDEHDILPVVGFKGWADYMYIVFFFFFAGLACTGCLFYFTLEDKDAVTISFGIRDHCGGYEDKWELSDGKMVLVGHDDIDWYYTDWEDVEDDFEDSELSIFYLECFEEAHRKNIRVNFNSTVEIYLLSLLLFVCLLIEMKEYVSVKGYLVYNILTVLYYIVECVTFFIFASNVFKGYSKNVNYDYSMTMFNSLNGPTNGFIMAVVVERSVIGVACLVLIYFSKEMNSTEYTAPEKAIKTLNESLSFFFIIGLSSVLAVVVLGVYVQDDSEPGEYIVAEECGEDVMVRFRQECGGIKASMREKACDLDWVADNWKWIMSEYYPDEDIEGIEDYELEFSEEDYAENEKICRACGVIPDDTSYSFFTDEQKLCITNVLGDMQEDNVDSFILAYAASYMFFLVLFHGERDRFQSTLGWYLFRLGFAIMLFAEGVAFMAFRGSWLKAKEMDIVFHKPRPMAAEITNLITAVAVIRFSILGFIFLLEQYEVGCSYCRCFWGICGKTGEPESKDIELSSKREEEEQDTANEGEGEKGRVKFSFFRS